MKQETYRTCPCCDETHKCVETFREEVERCARERTGEVILELGGEGQSREKA